MLRFSFYGFSMQILGFTFEVLSSPSNSAQDSEELDASRERDTSIYVETVFISIFFCYKVNLDQFFTLNPKMSSIFSFGILSGPHTGP